MQTEIINKLPDYTSEKCVEDFEYIIINMSMRLKF